VASNVRRIEAVTGRGAYDLIQKRFKAFKQIAGDLKISVDAVPAKVDALQNEVSELKKELAGLRSQSALANFDAHLSNVQVVKDINLLAMEVPGAKVDTLRMLADKFREKYPKAGAAVLVTGSTIIAVVTEDLVRQGLKAGDLIMGIGGKGGGRPNLAQGSLNGDVKAALDKLPNVLEEKIE
jgi:alanyl-tRNA synthetase